MTEQTFINAKIFTADPENRYADTMIVKDRRVQWIGKEVDLQETPESPIDLQGKRVLPGFIDAHLHPFYLADAQRQIACTIPNVYSIKDLIKRLQEQMEKQGHKGWIESWGYDEGKLTEGRAPNRNDLDQVSTDLPIIVTRTCAHIVAVNSKALEIAGITRDSLDPEGGEIDRNENGEPTGILRESAKDLVKDQMPTQTLSENAELLASLSPFLLAHGITGLTEMMALHEPTDYFTLYEQAGEKGLKQRTIINYTWEEFQKLEAPIDRLTDNQQHAYIGGIKLFADGSISGQTAWFDEPYENTKDNYGIQTIEPSTLLEAAEACKKHQLQLVIHAMGTQAIDLIIDTLENEKGWLTDRPSIRIEHASLPTEQAIEKAAKAGIAFVPQPVFLFAEIESYLHNLGTDRTQAAYPVKTMLEKGVQTAFSSDAPATAWADPVNPMIGLKSAVTRYAYDGTDIGQDERIDIETAITLYTKNAQEVTGLPQAGQLKAGYNADFIVLDQDILEIASEKIDQVNVTATYMNGKLAFQKTT